MGITFLSGWCVWLFSLAGYNEMALGFCHFFFDEKHISSIKANWCMSVGRKKTTPKFFPL